MRGEDLSRRSRRTASLETPPRAWGRRIPSRRRHGSIRKHPHVRGEDQGQAATEVALIETPPRAWGRLKSAIIPGINQRNTPTCVGKTYSRTPLRHAERKHPHVRGEDYRPFDTTHLKEETPPRAWGRLSSGLHCKAREGNTPTCVGKTTAPMTTIMRGEKHPHVRGEDSDNRLERRKC